MIICGTIQMTTTTGVTGQKEEKKEKEKEEKEEKKKKNCRGRAGGRQADLEGSIQGPRRPKRWNSFFASQIQYC